MPEFNEDNLNEKVENESTGNVSGFDSVNSSETGYTVTPEGGYYTKSADDIIQDEPITHEEPQQKQQYQNNKTYFDFENSQNSYGPSYHSPNNAGIYNYANNYYKPKKAKSSATVSITVAVISVILAIVLGAVSGAAVSYVVTKKNASSSGRVINAPNVSINVDEKYVDSIAQAVAEKASASVVGIRTTASIINFFGGMSETPGEGSGVIYSEDGYIVTNYHVIESAVENSQNSKIEVFLNSVNDTPYTATVIGYNISSDLAVIKINEKGLKAVELGDAKKLAVGQYAITIGAPGGLEFMGSVTYGIISGLDRVVSTNSTVKLIQTDAAINPGNSGGALLNTSGELIGINSSKIVSEEFEGMGFAIPIDIVKEKVNKIISRQNEPEPYVGITISERYTSDVLSYYGYPAGAVVMSVDEGSPASDAGIARGDIITEFNGVEIKEYTLFAEALNDCDPNTSVEAKIYRSGRYYTLSVKIGANS